MRPGPLNETYTINLLETEAERTIRTRTVYVEMSSSIEFVFVIF